jgi:hypothetical protein
VLIWKNPGGGGDSQVAATGFDLRVEQELKALRDAPSGEAHERLIQLTRTFHEQLPTISLGVLLSRALSRAKRWTTWRSSASALVSEKYQVDANLAGWRGHVLDEATKLQDRFDRND